MTSRWCIAAAMALLLTIAIRCAFAQAPPPFDWTTPPSYHTAVVKPPPFGSDDQGKALDLYDQSVAVLIIQGAYSNEDQFFEDVHAAAEKSAALLTGTLENLGFEVFVWRDLKSTTMRHTLDDIFDRFGGAPRSRLFFYYFGHSYSTGTANDPLARTYLVPVDSVNPVTWPEEFRHRAPLIDVLVEGARHATVEHAFFAIEACRAGAVIDDLKQSTLAPPLPHPDGWIRSVEAREQVRQFITSGNRMQQVPANNTFTTLLNAALLDNGAIAPDDYYLTGSAVMRYISQRLKQTAPEYKLDPQPGKWPPGSNGEFLFRRVTPDVKTFVDYKIFTVASGLVRDRKSVV